MSSMNDAQTIFTLFFAISWGIVSNVLPRWKPFHYALFCVNHQPTCRLIASWVLLNIFPWTLFWWSLVWLSYCPKMKPGGYWPTLSIVSHSILPGFFIPFGFYHLWLALMHASPTCFFFETDDKVPTGFGKFKVKIKVENKDDVEVEVDEAEPNATSLGLMDEGRNYRGLRGNGCFGIVGLALGMLCAYWC